MKTIISRWFVGVALLFASFSCSSWLEVAPDDRIMSEELFKDRAGFLVALNGVYAALNSPDLYGENLTVGMLDVMGQYYNVRGVSLHDYWDVATFGYTYTAVKTRGEAVWVNAYKLIGNCNAILEQCGEGNPVLPDNYYSMIKGEALALRAWLHFDLLRLFGPVWSNKTELAIPYMTSSDRATQAILPAEEVLALVVADLLEASNLLASVDPVLTEGPKFFAGEAIANGNDWNYRQLRLNYFAVRTILARAYLWDGDKTKAGEVARDVIVRANNPEHSLFPLTAPGSQGLVDDRIFSREVFFELYNTSRTEEIYNKRFSPDLSNPRVLGMSGGFGSGRVFYMFDDQNDYRYKMWSERTQEGLMLTLPLKYEARTTDITNLVPLVRLTEAYFIAAECEENVQDALDKYLNPVRLARWSRDLVASTPEDLMKVIAAEYTREFFGEGQLFYFFKRHELLTIPDGTFADATKAMTLRNYVFPMPDSELYPRSE
jgi:hypothetical protein